MREHQPPTLSTPTMKSGKHQNIVPVVCFCGCFFDPSTRLHSPVREETEPDAGKDAHDRGSHQLLLRNRREPEGSHGFNLSASGGQNYTGVYFHSSEMSCLFLSQKPQPMQKNAIQLYDRREKTGYVSRSRDLSTLCCPEPVGVYPRRSRASVTVVKGVVLAPLVGGHCYCCNDDRSFQSREELMCDVRCGPPEKVYYFQYETKNNQESTTTPLPFTRPLLVVRETLRKQQKQPFPFSMFAFRIV